MDTTRFSTVAGFAPAYTSRAALEEFAAAAAPGLLSAERVEAALGCDRPRSWARAGAERG